MINNEIYVLFIDDDHIDDQIESTKILFRRSSLGLSIRHDLVDMSSDALKSPDGNGNLTLDKVKVNTHLEKECLGRRYDIVACDYNFANDSNITGFNVLKHTINVSKANRHPIRNAKFIFYSSEEERSLQSMFEHGELMQLIRLQVEGFHKRDDLPVELVRLARNIKDEMNFSKYIAEKLRPFEDKIFRNTYPKFDGKSLGIIADEIESGGLHGIEFQKEIIDAAVAQMLKLNGIDTGH